jgi:predicted SnoaL-like aldol condensation-catalyzing enzyme
MHDLEHNKTAARTFFDLAFNQHKPQEAVKRYVGARYTQHNPEVADGPQGFIDFVTGFTRAHPKVRAEVKHVIAEGDLVVLHVHVRTHADDPGVATADIFRFDGGKIVEHWDVIQPVALKSANANTMF